ncbi:DUF177 domain-containing protein [Raineyella sp. LH-20]|uniref:YceD family protein n=1 Tax=Raineyella sp. LH-20 TaxID=3081204 RepID=UPI0029540A43|nr:DUF177 domain-containing protein [Raineyella sp. LH-20]WOP18427.1 DUF177 domain-containing protein [Raineyella sp. LH-20]
MTTHRTSAGHLDARSPLVLDTHDLGRRAGALREVRESVPAPEGIGNALIGIPTGAPIDLDLRLESVSEGVLVTGLATVRLEGECSRCLTPLKDETEVDLQELFLYQDQSVDDDDEDLARMQGELLDLEPTLRDAVVLDLPFTPLCREDCAGLCPECGANLNEDPDHTHGPATDARWGALSGWAGSDRNEADEDDENGDDDTDHVPDEAAGDEGRPGAVDD